MYNHFRSPLNFTRIPWSIVAFTHKIPAQYSQQCPTHSIGSPNVSTIVDEGIISTLLTLIDP